VHTNQSNTIIIALCYFYFKEQFVDLDLLEKK